MYIYAYNMTLYDSKYNNQLLTGRISVSDDNFVLCRHTDEQSSILLPCPTDTLAYINNFPAIAIIPAVFSTTALYVKNS